MPVYSHFIRDPRNNNLPNPAGLATLGAFFPIEVHVPPQIAQVLSAQGQAVPPPIAGLAIIDTGATMTCVHEPLLTQLGLNPISVVQAGTANGPVQQSVYPGRIIFPAQGWTIDLSGVAGVDLTGQFVPLNPRQPLVALLGRNILQHWLFIWNGPGGYWTVSM